MVPINTPSRMRSVASGTLGLALMTTFLAACSGDDAEPTSNSSADPSAGEVSAPVDVPPGTISFRRYLSAGDGTAALFTVATDGTGEQQVTSPPDGAVDSLPDWSPEADRIVFHREFSDKTWEIYTVAADGSDERQVDPGCPPDVPDAEICEEIEPAWSPDGKTLAFSWPQGGLSVVRGSETIDVRGIGVMKEDGSDATLITQTERPTSAEDGTPSWSPDGRQLVFSRLNITAEPLDASALFVINADGTGERRITPWELNAQDPAWSPDGELISFRSEVSGADFVGELHTVRPDGSRLTKLTDAEGKKVYGSSFSPDGSWIVFGMTGVGGLPDLFLMRSDGSDLGALTSTPEWDSAPDWSPR